MPRQLTITPTPFKSSFLAIPPSPFSPLLPITPAAKIAQQQPKPSSTRTAHIKASADLQPPPPEPLHWLWQCHKCNRVYKLGVTRRCLDDGHFFCAGTTVVKRTKRNGYKRTVRHAACASEFDYQGWKGWGVWRRGVVERVEAAERLVAMEEGLDSDESTSDSEEEEKNWFGSAWIRKSSTAKYWEKPKPLRLRKDCWNRCDYPSECRWGKQFGVQTPVVPQTILPSTPVEKGDVTPLPAPTTEKEKKPATTFEDILIDITDPLSVDYLAPLSPTNSHSPEVRRVTEGETKMTSPYDLVQSAKRRKRKSSGAMPLVPSPLALNPPSPEEEETPKNINLTQSLDDLELDLMCHGRKKDTIGDLSVLQRKADELIASWKSAKTKFSSASSSGAL